MNYFPLPCRQVQKQFFPSNESDIVLSLYPLQRSNVHLMLISILSYSKIEFITLQREKSAEKFYRRAPGTALKFFRSRIS